MIEQKEIRKNRIKALIFLFLLFILYLFRFLIGNDNKIPGPYIGAIDSNGIIHWEIGFSESGIIGKDKFKSKWEEFKQTGDEIYDTWN